MMKNNKILTVCLNILVKYSFLIKENYYIRKNINGYFINTKIS